MSVASRPGRGIETTSANALRNSPASVSGNFVLSSGPSVGRRITSSPTGTSPGPHVPMSRMRQWRFRSGRRQRFLPGVQWPQSACRRRLLDTDSSHGDKPKELELRGRLKNEGRRRFQKPLRPLSLRAFASLCIALSLAKQGLAYFSPPQDEAVHTTPNKSGCKRP